MLSNAYFLAKFLFDTAENEPAKNLQNFRKMHFSKMQKKASEKCKKLQASRQVLRDSGVEIASPLEVGAPALPLLGVFAPCSRNLPQEMNPPGTARLSCYPAVTTAALRGVGQT